MVMYLYIMVEHKLGFMHSYLVTVAMVTRGHNKVSISRLLMSILVSNVTDSVVYTCQTGYYL